MFLLNPKYRVFTNYMYIICTDMESHQVVDILTVVGIELAQQLLEKIMETAGIKIIIVGNFTEI